MIKTRIKEYLDSGDDELMNIGFYLIINQDMSIEENIDRLKTYGLVCPGKAMGWTFWYYPVKNGYGTKTPKFAGEL